MFRVLVIDDQYELPVRKKFYSDLLKDYSIIPLSIISEYGKIKSEKYDFVVLDLYLWNNGSLNEAEEIVSKIDKRIPVILVSEFWTDFRARAIEKVTRFMNKENVIKVISIARFKNESIENYEEMIYELSIDIKIHLNKFYNFSQIRVEEQESVSLLQIADLQFGGPVNSASKSDIYGLSKYLKTSIIDLSMLAICGDISDKGKKSEFDKAYEWIKKFRKNFWVEAYGENNIILTPGNHDYNINNYSSLLYDYSFDENCFVKNDESELVRLIDCVDNLSENDLDIIDETVFKSFSNFAYDVTGDVSWLRSDTHLNYIDNTYNNLGIRYISLNSISKPLPAVGVTGKNLKEYNQGVGFDISKCNKLLESNQEYDDDKFTVLVTHVSPYELGYGSSEKGDLWAASRSIIDSMEVDLWLYGHKHDNEIFQIQDYDNQNINGTVALGAGSLRLSSSKLQQDARRGFNHIKFIRDKGRVTKLLIEMFEMKGSSFDKVKVFEYDAKLKNLTKK